MKRLNQAPPLLSTTPSSAPTICFNHMRIHAHTLSGNQILSYGVVEETFTGEEQSPLEAGRCSGGSVNRTFGE